VLSLLILNDSLVLVSLDPTPQQFTQTKILLSDLVGVIARVKTAVSLANEASTCWSVVTCFT
jgi:hypothetical protein